VSPAALSIIVAFMASASLSCSGGTQATAPSVVTGTGGAGRLFSDDFESGTLDAWQDGINPSLHRVATDSSAQSGSRYLAVTFPAGRDGGWLTRFFLPGDDSMYVSYHVRFPSSWSGGTKLVAFYGSRVDDQWSGMGKAGLCPTGTDFFATMMLAEETGDPGPVRFYTYYPAMRREPNGVTCWGRYGDGSESYTPPLTLSPKVWHRIELSVRLNTPGQANGQQAFWIDGAQRGSWSGLSFRDTTDLRLNAVQLVFSVTGGVPRPQELHVDNLVVMTARP
jgi:hypothetical protein